MRKIDLKKVLMGMAMGVVILLTPVSAFAGTEKENNDNPANATVITSKEEVTGMLDSEEDVDFYKYKVDVTGHYDFTFKNVDAADASWNVEVYDSNLGKVESWHTEREYYSATTNTYNFKKGTIIYIKVSNYDNSEYANYSLKVNATETKDWEQEFNDTKKTATVISKNKEMFGNLYTEEDEDFYKYQVDVTGYYNFVFKNVDVADAEWHVAVYNSNLELLESWRLDSDDAYSATTKTYNFKKGTAIYIKIAGYEDSIGDIYSLKVNARSSSAWEQENNDTYSEATALKINKVKKGNLYIADDKDYYKITANKTGALKVCFSMDTDNVKDGWDIAIYDSTKNKIIEVDHVISDKIFTFKAKKGKKYYIVIQKHKYAGFSDWVPVDVTYSIKVK